ncbi:hypothetical protein VNO77_02289 [Canavalia gladiata]|uniref:Uncharacterized protein n=1 Tax=Canavalia gladiata TaxID=3824 RepID=A0AAN9R2X3_CANGL
MEWFFWKIFGDMDFLPKKEEPALLALAEIASTNSIDFTQKLVGSSVDVPNSSPACFVHLKFASLLKAYSFEEFLKLIFSVLNRWIASLVQCVLLFHFEELKSGLKMERYHSSLAKAAGIFAKRNLSPYVSTCNKLNGGDVDILLFVPHYMKMGGSGFDL